MEKKIGKKIMVVDDDRGILESFEVILGDDYPLVVVDSGEKALSLIEKEIPPLIFLDIYMPGIDGREILANMKSKGIESKVVVITGSSDEDLKEEVRNLGAYGFIKKPFDVGEIQNIAKAALVE